MPTSTQAPPRQNADGSWELPGVPGGAYGTFQAAQAAYQNMVGGTPAAAPTTAAPAAPSGPPTFTDLSTSLNPFLTGTPGASPALNSATEQFKAQMLPVLQQQFALQGLGTSPAMGNAIGISMGNVLTPLITNDLQNRLSAAQIGGQQRQGFEQVRQGDEELGQLAALRAAQIQDAASGRQLQGMQLAGSFGQASGNELNNLSSLLQSRQQNALSAFGSAGNLQRDVTQQGFDSAYQDYLRRQGLAEASTTGLFGGQVLPPTLAQGSKTTTQGGK